MLIENKKYKNMVLATVVFTIFILLFEIIPKYSDLASNLVALLEQSSVKNTIEENETELKELNKQINAFNRQMSHSVSSFNESSLSGIINHLDNLSKKSGIKNLAIKPGEIKKENNLVIQPVEINLNAEYENIFNYIRFLENSGQVIKIKVLKLKPVKPVTKILSLKANIEIYLNI